MSRRMLILRCFDPNPCERAVAAADPAGAPEMLTRLANDFFLMVRAAVTGNLSTSSEVLETLAAQRPGFVRAVTNSSVPERVLCAALEDPVPLVRSTANAAAGGSGSAEKRPVVDS